MRILAIRDLHGKFPAKLKNLAKDVDLVIAVGDYAGIRGWYKYLNYLFKEVKNKVEMNLIKSPKEFFGKEKYNLLIKKDNLKAKKVLKSLNKLNKKVIFVFGNADDEWYEYPFDKKIWQVKKSNIQFYKKLKNLSEITYSKTKFKNIAFIGFGGYMDTDSMMQREKKNGDKNKIKRLISRRQKSKRRLFNIIEKTSGKRIFVFHYPPAKVFDKVNDKKNPYHGETMGVDFFRQAIKKYNPSLVLCGHMHEYQGKTKIGKTLVVNPGAVVDGKGAIIDFDENVGKVKSVKFVK